MIGGHLLHCDFFKKSLSPKGFCLLQPFLFPLEVINYAVLNVLPPSAEMRQNCIHLEEVPVYPEKGHKVVLLLDFFKKKTVPLE